MIPAAIPQQAFELIRDQIGAVLAVEIPSQATLIGDTALNATVWVERMAPLTAAELPAINVQTTSANNDDYGMTHANDTILYNIDIHVGSKQNASENGDLRAQRKVQRLLGIVRAILANPRYKNLGFTEPVGYIATRRMTNFQIAEPNATDGNYIALARIIFEVRAGQCFQEQDSVPFSELQTIVTLDETDEGYKFITN